MTLYFNLIILSRFKLCRHDRPNTIITIFKEKKTNKNIYKKKCKDLPIVMFQTYGKN